MCPPETFQFSPQFQIFKLFRGCAAVSRWMSLLCISSISLHLEGILQEWTLKSSWSACSHQLCKHRIAFSLLISPFRWMACVSDRTETSMAGAYFLLLSFCLSLPCVQATNVTPCSLQPIHVDLVCVDIKTRSYVRHLTLGITNTEWLCFFP